ncbi:MAG: Synechococcus phage [Pseudomonadota bacterium]|jgi:tape measure domain-containing protein
MANNTIKFDIKAAVDTGGLDEFVSQLRQLKDVAEPADRVLGQAVKEIKAWAEGARVSERNTAAATTAINALTSAMTAGGNEWKRGTQAANELNRSLRETVNAANAAKAALAAPARTTSGAGQQIADMRKGLQDLTIGSAQYLTLLQQITEKEALLGRRTGRAGVVAANQAFEGALLTRGYGAPDRLQQMPDTTAALRQRLSELAQEFPNVIRGSERYVQIATEMRTIESQLARDLTGTTQALRQRSAATQAKIDAVRAYNEQAIRERVVNGELNIAERRRTNFGDVPQAMRTESGVFIAPPYRSGYSGFGTMYDRPIGPQTALDYFQSRANQFPAPIGPQTPLQYWQSRTTSGAMQGPAAPTDLFRSIGGIDTAGTTAKLQTMGRSYEQVAQQIRDTAQAAGGSTRALQAERQAWEQLQASVAPASREYRQAGREMQRLDRQMGASRRGERFLESAGAISAGAFFGGPEGLAGGLLGMAVGGPGAALGGASIGAQVGIVRKGIGDMAVYSAELGKMRIALQGVVKTQEDYARSITIVNDATARLNIPLQESLGGFTRLAASIIGAGGSISDAEVVFRGITGALKATGKGANEVQGSITALSQIFSKGKLSAEEINQIAERLPGTFNLIAQAARKTGPGELAKALEQGQVSLSDVMRFSDSLIIKYEDSGERIAKSSEEAGARAGVALDRLREKIGETFRPAGADLQNNIAQWANWGVEVVDSIGNVYKSLKDLERSFFLSKLLNDFREARQLRPEPEQQPQSQRYGPAAPANTNDGIRNRIQQLTVRLNGLQRNSEDFKRLQGQIRTLEDKLAESYTPFATPGGNDEKARKAAEREERKRQEEAARRQRLELQLNNDRVRLDEQRAENAIRLEDRIFQHRQGLMRRERDQQLQLDQLRQQILFTSLSPEGRTAAGPIQELLQRFQSLTQDRQDIVDRLSSAEQALKSAQKNLDNVTRSFSAYQDAEQRSARPSDGDTQSSRTPGIGDQFLARIFGGRFEEVAGLQPLPLQRMYRQMGRQVQRWTNYIQNEAEYWLKEEYGTKKPLIPQEIIDSTIEKVRVITDTIQRFDPLELQFRELENKSRGASGSGRSKPAPFNTSAFDAIFSKIERRVLLDAHNSLQRAGGYLAELGPKADLSDFLPENTKRFLADSIRQMLSDDDGGFRRRYLETDFSHHFRAFFNDTVRTIELERSRSAPARGGAGGHNSLELPAAPRTPSGGVDYLMQYRNLRELMEPPRITPGVQNQFDGASLIPLLKKFESVASLGYIPVSIKNPDVIAQAIIAGGARTNRVRDRDAETTGWDITHPGGRGAPVRAPIDLTITGTGFQGRGSGRTGRGYGNWITGEFELGGKKYELLLGHFDRVDVAPGMRVPAGVQLGTQGITGRTIGAHTTTHVNPKGSASAQDAWNALEQLTQRWERGGLTTTLSNGREIRTPGAAAAALRAASATGQVDEARAAVKQIRAELALFDRDQQAFSDLSVSLGIEQTVQSLKDQEIALRDNYSEWKVRNRLQLEGVKPEIIDFEVNKTNALERQKRRLDDMDRLMKRLGPAFDAIGKGDAFRGFMEQSKGEIQRRTSGIIALQSEAALAATDPMLEWQNKMNDLEKSARDFNDTLKLAINLSNQFSGSLASGFSSAASSIISGNGSIQQSFADLFNNVSKMFIDTIARVLADQATSFILDLLKPAASSIAPGPVAVANGIVPRAGFMGPGFATGGVSSGPTSGYPVTLHGTEAVVPLPNGRAIPVEMKGSGGTSVVVNVNMGTGEASVSSSERDGQLLGTALSDAVQAELIRQQRPGGILYRR